MTEIRKAEEEDLPTIYKIYEKARAYMRSHGNPVQWGDNYPPEELTKEDLNKERLYVITKDSTPEAVFVFYAGVEEAYAHIDGLWTYDLPYGVVHRVASSGRIRNVTKKIFDYCFGITNYLRIDTHEANTTMQSALLRYGFRHCGTIFYNRNNSLTSRIAYDCRGKSI